MRTAAFPSRAIEAVKDAAADLVFLLHGPDRFFLVNGRLARAAALRIVSQGPFELMRQAGCAEVLIGLESPRAEGVEGVELLRNWKRGRFDDYRSEDVCSYVFLRKTKPRGFRIPTDLPD